MSWTEITRAQYRRDGLTCASDLNDAEWLLLSFFLPAASHVGRPREVDLRHVVNAILYVLSTGCQWRALPRVFPPRSTVQYYFYLWRDQRLWRRINLALVRRARNAMGRDGVPTAGVIDSQSVKTTESGGPRGFDAAKKVRGRKRHLVTDTQGLPLALLVHPANIQDNHGAVPLLAALRRTFPRLRYVVADRVYRGKKLRKGDRGVRPLAHQDRHPIRADRHLQTGANTLGDRAHLRLDRTQSPPRKGLRAHHCQLRGLVPHRFRQTAIQTPRKNLCRSVEF